MYQRLTFICLTVIVAAVAGYPLAATAQAQPANLADTWMVVPKSGQADAFEKALKKHLAYRANKGDPREWKSYVPVVGSELDHYLIRHCCTSWSDQDGYVAWGIENKLGAHWNDNVDQYVERYEHYFATIDFENNHWPEDDTAYRYFGVTAFEPKMGHGAQIAASKTRLSEIALEGEWPRYWSWSSRIGGDGGLFLVAPYRDYSGMAPAEQSFTAFMAKRLGSEEMAAATMQKFTDNFHGSTYTVYRIDDDLSM